MLKLYPNNLYIRDTIKQSSFPVTAALIYSFWSFDNMLCLSCYMQRSSSINQRIIVCGHIYSLGHTHFLSLICSPFCGDCFSCLGVELRSSYLMCTLSVFVCVIAAHIWWVLPLFTFKYNNIIMMLYFVAARFTRFAFNFITFVLNYIEYVLNLMVHYI